MNTACFYLRSTGHLLYIFLPKSNSAWIAQSAATYSGRRMWPAPNFVSDVQRTREVHKAENSVKLCASKANQWLKKQGYRESVSQILNMRPE